jgi:hypothetical protein
LRRFSGGAWMPLFVYASAVNVGAAALFTVAASITPARERLRKNHSA